MSSPPTGWQAPKMNWHSGDNPNPTDFNRIEGNPNAIENGNRTIDDSQVPGSDEGTLREILSWMCNRIKEITGETNWYDNPSKTLAQLQLIDDLDDISDGTVYGRVKKSALSSGKHKLDECINGSYGKVIISYLDGDGRIDRIKVDCQFEEAITRYYAVPLVGCNVDSPTVIFTGHSIIMPTGEAILPVILPHEAIVTRLTIWTDGDLTPGHIKLNRSDHNANDIETMATLVNTGYTESISYSQIDNYGHEYFVYLLNTSGSTRIINGILITYTVVEPRP